MSVEPSPAIKLDEQGLVTAVCQDADNGRVLMIAHMSPESIAQTFKCGQMVFYSRSRQEIWHKGQTSGAFLNVVSAQSDCDGDVLLFQVRPEGPACHTGMPSCFFTELAEYPEYALSNSGPGIINELFGVVLQRHAERPEGSYTSSLFEAGTARIAQKVAEEGSEVALAAATNDVGNLPGEVADLLYHTLVLLVDSGVSIESIWSELRKRRG